ncbi:hypothetical protein CDL15_Pgr013195 [Punica granatum]|uniref:Uncharacterized protein n=1 Tax=Punica granatum TaxID=22663 RepID=A0A218WWC5_PUNGR|nr:hypothetical protein CDL15_Pgr013195 [Punica granatum]
MNPALTSKTDSGNDFGLGAVSELEYATASSSHKKANEKQVAFDKFSERHETLLIAFTRQNPELSEKSFSLLLKVAWFIEFDNKRAHFS